ncbi:MAG: HD-GYP domain-containing protein [Solirubrobacterales bacterium]
MTDDAAVPGGILLYSPEARSIAAKLATLHTVVIVAAIAVIAYDGGHFDAATVGILAGLSVWALLMPMLPWGRVSHNWLAKVYFLGAGTFVFFAFHFDNPYLLLGVYPEAVAFADVYWYRRSLLALHQIGLFAVYTAAALLIGGGNAAAALILIAMPVMAASALIVGLVTNRFICAQLKRTQFQSTVTSLLEALHARDGYTGDHSKETLAMAMAVADELQLDDEVREQLSDVALLHDIGKIGIPNSILQKPGKLSAEEWKEMERHPVVGEQILRDIPGFEGVAKAVRHEHERWDGGGYPDGIRGEAIPLPSRIVLACDAFHAMTSDRPYRAAMEVSEARAELSRHAGTQFDPNVVDALQRALDAGAFEPTTPSAAPAEPAGVQSLVTEPEDFQLPVSVAEMTADEEWTLRDPRLIAGVTTASWALIAVVMSAYLLVHRFDWAGVGVVGASAAVAAASIFMRGPRAVGWSLATGLSAYAMIPLTALYFDEPAMLVFLLLTSSALSAFFWHRAVIRALQVALVLVAFAVLPVVLFGSGAVTFAAVGTRAFPGVLLVLGYFMMKLAELRFDRARFGGTMTSLLLALHARDGYTGRHSDQTVELAMLVADQLQLDDGERMELKDVALLHDIGKIGVPDEVLNKPGALNDQEWRLMRQHPVIGEQIVARVPGFGSVAKAIRHEHERWDGGGYPDGLAGESIPLASRIVLACDAYNAMTTDRPYRASLGAEVARNELVRCVGTQFDPRVVNALLGVLDGSALDLPAAARTEFAAAAI